MEAIEVDVFRQRYEHDTFWCGTLLGGCGSQVTTKLYTDRVCHFAHHPAADGTPHCGRNARGVASADHLYVKAAASAWLRGSGYQEDLVRFDFARPRGADIGSVVDIAFRERGLRVHLDQSVEPVWDEEGH
ncbi:zinc finger domain-containing protein, partial [Streptomyces xanthophaeus]